MGAEGNARHQRVTKIPNLLRTFRKDRYLYLILALPFLYYLIFHYGPMFGILMAFKEFNVTQGILGSPWAGTRYFKEFLSEPYFWKVLRNTLVLNLSYLAFSFPMPILFALMLNELKGRKFKRVVQTVSYLPYFVSTVVLCGMVTMLLSTDGMVNTLIRAVGREKISFLMRPEWFRPVYIVSGIWQNLGWSSIVYLAALTTIDPGQYEAAYVDGANRFQRLLHITLPGLMPTITVMLILSVGNLLGVSFEKVLLLYTGSTYEVADVIQTYVYRRGLISSQFSYGTAVGLFQSVVGFFFLITVNRLSRKFGETSLW